jgi:hypothetical protein
MGTVVSRADEKVVVVTAGDTKGNDKSDCPIKYPDPNSKEYCECVVGRADKIVCSTYHLSPSPITITRVGAIMLMVGAVVLVVGMGVGGVGQRKASTHQRQPAVMANVLPKCVGVGFNSTQTPRSGTLRKVGGDMM